MWKRRKQKKQVKISPIIISLIVLITSLLIFLILKSKQFTIKQIDIEANHLGCASFDELRNTSGVFGQNFFVFDENKITKNLLGKFICIKDINIARIFPNKIKVKITGRDPALKLASLKYKLASSSSLIENIATPSAEDMTDYFIVDNEGVILSKGTDNLNIPKVYLYNLNLITGIKFESKLVADMLKILDKIKTLGVLYNDSWVIDELFLVNSEIPRIKIAFRLNNKVDIQLASLQLILDKAKINEEVLEFIDLRFDKPVVKFAPKK